jgi:hypothetical protein
MKTGIPTNVSKNRTKFEKRKVAFDYLTELVAKIPPERMSKSVIGVGEKRFSANELLEEVKKDSEEGNRFLDAIYAAKLELLKKMSAQEDGRALKRSN